ncbi:MAG: DUF389 domain-containing protein [bacterium]
MSIRDQISMGFDVQPGKRQEIMAAHITMTERSEVAYWLELTMATGITILGLCLNSTAVVLGAMLLSPLTLPIVQIGLSFATGFLYLTMRSFIRVILSLVFVISLSSLVTALLPFREITAEIAARTQPTALDLLIALFCGLAASFAVTRRNNDAVTAAAGTITAVALVPPLCVVGFGIGIASKAVTLGATLLFITNFAAIVLVSTSFFLLLGFDLVDLGVVEKQVFKESHCNSPLFKFVKHIKTPLLRPPWRFVSRLLLPLIFVAIIAQPLAKGLSEVAWQITAKTKSKKVLDDMENKYSILQRSILVSHGQISVVLTAQGESDMVEKLRNDVRMRLGMATGVDPTVQVKLVPSTEAINNIAEKIATLQLIRPAAPPPPPEPTPFEHLQKLKLAVNQAIGHLALPPETGKLLRWGVEFNHERISLHLLRLSDAPLDKAAQALLAQVIEKETHIPLNVHDECIPVSLISASKPEEVTPGPELASALQLMVQIPSLRIKATMPDPSKIKFRTARNKAKQANARCDSLLKQLPVECVVREVGENWVLTVEEKPVEPLS